MGEVERLEVPNGAIHNGREHLRRLVAHYDFACEAGGLANCSDYTDAVRCFEVLVEYIRQANALLSRISEERGEALSVNAGLRDALEFYRDNWGKSGPPNEPRYDDDREPNDALWADCGRRAESALKELGYVPVKPDKRDALLSQLEEMREREKRTNVLLRLLTVGQILRGGDEAILAAGLDPWCVNEGRAEMDDRWTPPWANTALLSQTDEGKRMEGDGE